MKRNLSFLGLLLCFLMVGCSGCNRPDTAGVDSDVVDSRDADAESDSNREDSDVDETEDVDIPEGTERVNLVELTHARTGIPCGPGCKQLTYAATIMRSRWNIAQNYAVYLGGRESNYDVILVELSTGEEFQFESCQAQVDPYICGTPTIFEDTLVLGTIPWDEDLDWTLWKYQIGEHYRTPIIKRTMTARASPTSGLDLHENMLAFWDSADDPPGNYAMDINGTEVIDITPVSCPCYGDPHIWDRHAVFIAFRENEDIWVVNVDTVEETNVTNDNSDQFQPAFDGQWIVWTDGRNDPVPRSASYRPNNTDIYGKHFPDGEIVALCDHPAAQLHPEVHSGIVVWEDFRNAEDPNDGSDDRANIDIYMLDIESGREVQVSNLPGPERYPRVWGRNIFFQATDDLGGQAIFMVNIDEAGLLD